MTQAPLAPIGFTPDKKSKLSPTGYPTSVRHLVAYHNPDTMGYEFWECKGFKVLTNHHYKHLKGDFVWVLGRPSDTESFYLDCRFKVTELRPVADDPDFDLEVSGTDGFVFYPDRRLNPLPWFKRLREINPNFSLGLQVVNEPIVIQGLIAEYTRNLAIQSGSG
jgi:hypothetical protein